LSATGNVSDVRTSLSKEKKGTKGLVIRFEEALKAAQENENQMKQHKLVTIGASYVTHLLQTGSFTNIEIVTVQHLITRTTGKYDTAAQLCSKILGRDPNMWETWIYKFAEMRQLKVRHLR